MDACCVSQPLDVQGALLEYVNRSWGPVWCVAILVCVFASRGNFTSSVVNNLAEGCRKLRVTGFTATSEENINSSCVFHFNYKILDTHVRQRLLISLVTHSLFVLVITKRVTKFNYTMGNYIWCWLTVSSCVILSFVTKTTNLQNIYYVITNK